MIFALVFAPIMVYLNLGGMDEIHAAVSMAAQANNKNYGNLLFGTSFVGIISAAAWGLGYLCIGANCNPRFTQPRYINRPR